MFFKRQHLPPPDARNEHAPVDQVAECDRDERRHEALRRFGYEPAVIYGLATETDHSRGLTSPF